MVKEYRNCFLCKSHIDQPSGIGKARKYCSDHCRLEAARKRKIQRVYEKCHQEGCENDATRVGARMCEKHYIMAYRRGSSQDLSPNYGVIPGPLEIGRAHV